VNFGDGNAAPFETGLQIGHEAGRSAQKIMGAGIFLIKPASSAPSTRPVPSKSVPMVSSGLGLL
jgi:hypothetical protein